MNTLWYFPIESMKSRYTEQLCEEWMPAAFEQVMKWYEKVMDYRPVPGKDVGEDDIVVGQVLDATGRGIYSLGQCMTFLHYIRGGFVKNGDVVFLQDYWTPGLESIFYALDMYHIDVKFYAMLHAQSVDEYDFTHDMLPWIRLFELGIDQRMAGIFVASTVHKEQLKKAGWRSPIHVVSLPFGQPIVAGKYEHLLSLKKEKLVIYCSRLDKEKNPYLMLNVAERFLDAHPDWWWLVTTSGAKFKSNDNDVIRELRALANSNQRFILGEGLTKDEYYTRLAMAAIQFNSSWQDYVSWTLIEATQFGCDICYPNFRSFPECVPADRLYDVNDPGSALQVLDECIRNPRTHLRIPAIANAGRMKAAEIAILGDGHLMDVNVWAGVDPD